MIAHFLCTSRYPFSLKYSTSHPGTHNSTNYWNEINFVISESFGIEVQRPRSWWLYYLSPLCILAHTFYFSKPYILGFLCTSIPENVPKSKIKLKNILVLFVPFRLHVLCFKPLDILAFSCTSVSEIHVRKNNFDSLFRLMYYSIAQNNFYSVHSDVFVEWSNFTLFSAINN